MAEELRHKCLIILTAVKAAINYEGKENEVLDDVTVEEMKKYVDEGRHPGSMNGQFEAGCGFKSKKEGYL